MSVTACFLSPSRVSVALFQLVLLCTLAPPQVFLLPFLSQSAFLCPSSLSLFAAALLSKCLTPICVCQSLPIAGEALLVLPRLLNTAVLFLVVDGILQCSSSAGWVPSQPINLWWCGNPPRLQLQPLSSPLPTRLLPPGLLCWTG